MASSEEQSTTTSSSSGQAVANHAAANHGAANSDNYEVLARRHRPQSFDDLVGQDAPAKALQNAIKSHRVGHAYLFTGARGVGKTSTARIFSKALNCKVAQANQDGRPCQECETCRDIANGRDIDVIEIDGASNRGIDEIRQLRSTVNVRPSRSPYKIYIIDEVHMLTTPAFNALLKTLEEPPAHVKFIFCTTDPEKIPITVLSRCQRFDFSTVETKSIAQKLRDIVDSDPSVEADDEALKLIARRARGSVRDSQSLLEQVLAFCEGRVTKDAVHSLLGTAQGGSMLSLFQALAQADPAKALALLDEAITSGVDPGQLAEQLLGVIRDSLAFAVGCKAEMGQHSDESDYGPLQEIGNQIGVGSLLAMSQVIDQSLTRMRHSTQPRVVLELALVRASQLSQLSRLPQLLSQSGAGTSAVNQIVPTNQAPSGSNEASSMPTTAATPRNSAPSPSGTPVASTGGSSATKEAADVPTTGDNSPSQKSASASSGVAKKNEKVSQPSSTGPTNGQTNAELNEQSARRIWSQAVTMLEDTTADLISGYSRVAIDGPNSLAITLKSAYNKELCERPERKSRIEAVVEEVANRRIAISFSAPSVEARPKSTRGPSRANFHQLRRELEKHPLVIEAIEILDAEIEDVQFGRPKREPEN